MIDCLFVRTVNLNEATHPRVTCCSQLFLFKSSLSYRARIIMTSLFLELTYLVYLPIWRFGILKQESLTVIIYDSCNKKHIYLRRVWRYKRGNQNRQPIDQKDNKNDLQNIAHKSKDRVIRTALKTGGKFICSGRVSSS